MDALSALKMVQTTQLGGIPASTQTESVAKTISPAELQQLGSINSDTPFETSSVSGTGGANFENMLGGLIGEVSQKQAAAGNAVTGLLSGKNVSLHQAMISMEEANVSFQMMVEVRNRLLDSYQELMRMQI
jgi:flagellar hook-basal body complex protein FliE